ncbi:uncharacterized protein LOC126847156 [Adelges cooleyi]|uniref:uncharacterized protein LOC126847156 n=1 Tax=Adelges cooleyi TaxID=133065 RepID=UPI00218020A8|nr:uncharacterized protein LOC126847156 [Adelges cooleyi]
MKISTIIVLYQIYQTIPYHKHQNNIFCCKKTIIIFIFMEPFSTTSKENIIEEVDVYLFKMPVEYSLGHCVSKDMHMSAGIASYFKSVFGRVGELMDQRPGVGDVAYLKVNDRFVFYLVTKELKYLKPTYKTLTSAVIKLRDLIVKHNVKKLALPRIGCGLDKLDWKVVKQILYDKFQDAGCMIKICHFTHDKDVERKSFRILHPRILKTTKEIKNIGKREFEKLNFILYAYSTTTPVYWDYRFNRVNDKYNFKSQYFKDFNNNLMVGECLYYSTNEAHVFVIFVKERLSDSFSYQNLESGLLKIKNIIYTNQWHPTFIVQELEEPAFERTANQKITSLISTIFIPLTPCVIFEKREDFLFTN